MSATEEVGISATIMIKDLEDNHGSRRSSLKLIFLSVLLVLFLGEPDYYVWLRSRLRSVPRLWNLKPRSGIYVRYLLLISHQFENTAKW
jgi:hypothetical protein